MKKTILTLAFLLCFSYATAENCAGSEVLLTDCNIATQLIDTSNNPVEDAACDANLYKPNGDFAFQGNQPTHWETGIYLIESDANFTSLGIYVFSIKCIDGGDTYFGSTEYTIITAEAIEVDPNNCEISVSAQRSKQGNYYIFSASGFNSRRVSTGLTPTIEILDLDKGIKTINQTNMIESSQVSGLYTYYFNGLLLPSSYNMLVTFDANCSKLETFDVEKTEVLKFAAGNGLSENSTEENDFNQIYILIIGIAIIAILIFLVALYIIQKRGKIV